MYNFTKVFNAFFFFDGIHVEKLFINCAKRYKIYFIPKMVTFSLTKYTFTVAQTCLYNLVPQFASVEENL